MTRTLFTAMPQPEPRNPTFAWLKPVPGGSTTIALAKYKFCEILLFFFSFFPTKSRISTTHTYQIHPTLHTSHPTQHPPPYTSQCLASVNHSQSPLPSLSSSCNSLSDASQTTPSKPRSNSTITKTNPNSPTTKAASGTKSSPLALASWL